MSAVRTVMRFARAQDMEKLTPNSTTYRYKHSSHHLRTHTRKMKDQNVKEKHDSPAHFNPFNF